MTSTRQVNDWMNHPEKYDANTDDDFANFRTWMILFAELNGLIDENGNRTEKTLDPNSTQWPTRQQVIIKVNQLRRSRY